MTGIQALYGTIGRASADVNPQTSQDSANRRVNITFEINEGPEVFVERINITGNTRSQEKILRREIPMHEGDFFTTAKLERARQRLTNLGYFEQVKATTAPGSAKDKIVVNIEVAEKPTGLFSIGGGYSSADSFIATLDLSQRNFLGRGWEVFLRVRAGARDPAGHHRLHRALALRPAAVRRASTCSTTGASTATTPSTPSAATSASAIPSATTRAGTSSTGSPRTTSRDVADNASTSLLEEEGTRITSLVGGVDLAGTRATAPSSRPAAACRRRDGRRGPRLRGQ